MERLRELYSDDDSTVALGSPTAAAATNHPQAVGRDEETSEESDDDANEKMNSLNFSHTVLEVLRSHYVLCRLPWTRSLFIQA